MDFDAISSSDESSSSSSSSDSGSGSSSGGTCCGFLGDSLSTFLVGETGNSPGVCDVLNSGVVGF